MSERDRIFTTLLAFRLSPVMIENLDRIVAEQRRTTAHEGESRSSLAGASPT